MVMKIDNFVQQGGGGGGGLEIQKPELHYSTELVDYIKSTTTTLVTFLMVRSTSSKTG